MVDVKGYTTKDLTFIVLANDGHVSKKDGGKLQWANVMLAQLDGVNDNVPHQNMSSLSTNAKSRFTAPYTRVSSDGKASQMDAVRVAAGDNYEPLLNKDGEAVGTAYLVQGDMMFKGSGDNRTAVLNTTTLRPVPDHVKIPENFVNAHFEQQSVNARVAKASPEAWNAYRTEKCGPPKEKEQTQEKSAPQAEQQVEQQQPVQEQPAPQADQPAPTAEEIAAFRKWQNQNQQAAQNQNQQAAQEQPQQPAAEQTDPAVQAIIDSYANGPQADDGASADGPDFDGPDF